MRCFAFGAVLLVLPLSCFDAREIPSPGLLYSNHKFDGGFSSANDVVPTKQGRSCMEMVFGVIASGNAGVAKTAEAANIDRIAYVDHEFFNILGLFSRYCTVVYGD